LIDRKRWHSSEADVAAFREDGCDADHYMVIADVTDILPAVNDQMERFTLLPRLSGLFPFRINVIFNLQKLNDVADKEQYQVKVSIEFVALEN
jgi:hypothetical protein